VAKRSYGTGRLYVVVDRGGRASWYGSWWVGTTRVKRKIGLKRTAGNADGLTRTQAERELRRRVEATVVVAQGQRRTIGEAGDAYISHLENVMERKRTTIADYRGYLRRHLAPFFGDRPMDRIDPAKVEAYPARQARRRAVAQDGAEPPRLPARHLRVRDPAYVGDREPRRPGRAAPRAPLGPPPNSLPAA
jgi:integrase